MNDMIKTILLIRKNRIKEYLEIREILNLFIRLLIKIKISLIKQLI